MLEVTSGQLNLWIAGLLLPLTRILAVFAIAPVFASTAIPKRVKVGLALALTILVAPSMPAGYAPAELFGHAGLLAVAREVLIGLAMGFAVRIVFAAVEFAGDVTAQMIGLSFASLYDPQFRTRTTPVGQLYGQIAIALFVTLNLHHVVIAALIDSFSMQIPPGLDNPIFLDGVIRWGKEIFRIGFQISLPIVGTLLATNMALALLTRAVPQLNLFGVGFPITFSVGFLSLLLMAPYLVASIASHLEQIGAYLSIFR